MYYHEKEGSHGVGYMHDAETESEAVYDAKTGLLWRRSDDVVYLNDAE